MKKIALTILLGIMSLFAHMAHSNDKLEYPVVLVHGLFGFDNLLGVDYFYRVPSVIEQEGGTVYVAEVSSAHNSELRGEQLLEQIALVRALTGKDKVNLIGHSQGAQTIRYAASVKPQWVASVTSIGGVNWGSRFADVVRNGVDRDSFSERFLASLANALAGLIDLLSGKATAPKDALQALDALTTEGTLVFNQKYPEGVPATYCGQGRMRDDNGVYYFSWSGNKAWTNVFDPADSPLALISQVFDEANDGLVSACSSNLGYVIGNQFKMNHLDQVNQTIGIHHLFETDPLTLYRQHVRRLKGLNL
ncbi:esterase/lipase family protein [Pseudoalteromonas luteoviolacea]|uniref:Putative acetyltransferase n=1 Tax=Pseudoalteromonas luteoviolacea (strain 2ta16) TaxID=1353533 RepID=V4H007_PSEL2|nr:triacylglycerol lipase [Pseudoalteromonas luteoviolacea]ESP90771.1 putative acetyltransferase [Pseudoalteromonas luteoviolacea 2ta16]KZN41655.1 lactonizing lipase [Pseudoalteromonas luteoviolacea NCIMB 1944]